MHVKRGQRRYADERCGKGSANCREYITCQHICSFLRCPMSDCSVFIQMANPPAHNELLPETISNVTLSRTFDSTAASIESREAVKLKFISTSGD